MSLKMRYQSYQPVTNQVSDSSEVFLDPFAFLKEFCQKSSNRPIVAQLNINSLKNKFNSLREVVQKNFYILLISEIKTVSSFPTLRFYLDGLSTA